MKYTKKQIDEVVDANGELIGDDDMVTHGGDLESAANNTTDYNSKISHQPYRYDMLGRFGFTLLPFFESEDKEKDNDNLTNEIEDLSYDHFIEVLEYYYKNPQKIKSDYRKETQGKQTDTCKKFVKKWTNDLSKIVKETLNEALSNLNENLKENINENSFVEGKMVEKGKDKEVVDKTKDKGITDKNLEKIAGLLNKELDDGEKDKLITLIEIRNE